MYMSHPVLKVVRRCWDSGDGWQNKYMYNIIIVRLVADRFENEIAKNPTLCINCTAIIIIISVVATWILIQNDIILFFEMRLKNHTFVSWTWQYYIDNLKPIRFRKYNLKPKTT